VEVAGIDAIFPTLVDVALLAGKEVVLAAAVAVLFAASSARRLPGPASKGCLARCAHSCTTGGAKSHTLDPWREVEKQEDADDEEELAWAAAHALRRALREASCGARACASWAWATAARILAAQHWWGGLSAKRRNLIIVQVSVLVASEALLLWTASFPAQEEEEEEEEEEAEGEEDEEGRRGKQHTMQGRSRRVRPRRTSTCTGHGQSCEANWIAARVAQKPLQGLM